jgi:superfamily II DNA or RNA helicase
MNIIKISNDFSHFLSPNEEIRQELWDRLRFREKNYFHNRAYKMRKWDGYIEFFDKNTGKFLTGLLPEVSAFLRHKNIEYTVEDIRNLTEFNLKEVDESFLKDGEFPVDLRDYQVELINQVIKHRRGIIFAPTSAGKSLIMIGIIKTLKPNTPVLVLQNRLSLAQQNYDELVKLKFPNVGNVWGGSIKPNIITVASVQSVTKIEKLLPKIKVLIVDEIHDMMSRLPKAVYRRLKAADVRVAVSATPFKFGGKDNVQKFSVRGYFGPIFKVKSAAEGILTTSELQSRGILSNSKCIFYPIREPQIPHDIYIDAVTRGIAENFYFHKVVSGLANKQKGRTLILVDRIAHGDVLNNLIAGSLWIQGKDDADTRKSVIKELQKSEQCVAIATQQIFNTGINVYLHNLINAAGGQADHQIIQRMGRGLRTADDKEVLNYYDFVFEINDYLEKHSRKRIKILKQQGHEVSIEELP